MSGQTPATELRRAAAVLRERAAAARARGPYFVEGKCLCNDDEEFEDRCSHRLSSWRLRTCVPNDPTFISYEVTAMNDEGNAEWLALFGPDLAEPLASWLDSAADYNDAQQFSPTALVQDYPMAVARLILVGVQATDG